ncbi:MAG: AAA family ATPase [Eubacteriales bacterium]|nr:AAA family ATPase [Eubacteriales bacterium]
MNLLSFLKEEQISETLLSDIDEFRRANGEVPLSEDTSAAPRFYYYGKDVWEEALTALICGRNLLLVGSKATGKNVLCDNLAAVFGRPSYNLSFHINMDASYMIGTDTFRNGGVEFRPGPVYRCAKDGGFCILDEINMARNEALAVLHSVLDFRRMIEVPGYDRINIHPAARFIATMNYGYAGTRDLNEALLSRFAVIRMPEISEDGLKKLLHREYPSLSPEYERQFAGLFMDIERKYQNGEISSSILDLRGLIDAIGLMDKGLSPLAALDMGITNKTFESYEQNLLHDVIAARIPKKASRKDIFTA